MPSRWIVLACVFVLGIGGGVGIAAARQSSPHRPIAFRPTQVPNPRLDTGMRLNFVAPAFTLTDQFGKTVSLDSFHGKVVVVSFNDPLCTTICPLTTTALLEAKKLLGPAGTDVQLLGVGANPEATAVKWVRSYSQAHRMMQKWLFLTGSLPQLKRVWASYGILAEVNQGTIDHTPATYIVGPNGRVTRLFITRMSYSSVPQLAQVLARAIAADLPDHPKVRHVTSLAPIELITPRQRVGLATAGGGTMVLGPGYGPHLVLFFNTWEQEVTHLGAHLEALNGYASMKYGAGLTAIDEANVEPSPSALPAFLRTLHLTYPVVVDPDGRVADGYRVQNSPWLTLVSSSGRILWRYDVGDKGWPTTAELVSHVHAALK